MGRAAMSYPAVIVLFLSVFFFAPVSEAQFVSVTSCLATGVVGRSVVVTGTVQRVEREAMGEKEIRVHLKGGLYFVIPRADGVKFVGSLLTRFAQPYLAPGEVITVSGVVSRSAQNYYLSGASLVNYFPTTKLPVSRRVLR